MSRSVHHAYFVSNISGRLYEISICCSLEVERFMRTWLDITTSFRNQDLILLGDNTSLTPSQGDESLCAKVLISKLDFMHRY